MKMIQEVYIGTAANADVLKAPSRLAAIPISGVLTLEYSADIISAANYCTITVQTPEGDVPLDTVKIPANGHAVSGSATVQVSVDGILDDRTEGMLQFTALRGGHYTIGFTNEGTGTNWILRATLEF